MLRLLKVDAVEKIDFILRKRTLAAESLLNMNACQCLKSSSTCMAYIYIIYLQSKLLSFLKEGSSHRLAGVTTGTALASCFESRF